MTPWMWTVAAVEPVAQQLPAVVQCGQAAVEPVAPQLLSRSAPPHHLQHHHQQQSRRQQQQVQCSQPGVSLQQQPQKLGQAAVEPVVPQLPNLNGAIAVMRGGIGPPLKTLLNFVVAHKAQRSRGAILAILLREENHAPSRKHAAGLLKRSLAARLGSPRVVSHPARRLLQQLRAVRRQRCTLLRLNAHPEAAGQPLRQIRCNWAGARAAAAVGPVGPQLLSQRRSSLSETLGVTLWMQ